MKNKQQGIYIPMDIWRIKGLNLNEKLVLSDMINKSGLDNYKYYNKKNATLAKELGITEERAADTFKSLQKKGYITSTPLRKRREGRFATVLSRRDINREKIAAAPRFTIPEDNIFYCESKIGCYFDLEDIQTINGWSIRKRYAMAGTKYLILFLIIKKIAFINHMNEMRDNITLYARFTIKELAEFMGISRYTAGKYINGCKEICGLAQEGKYNEKPLRILYKMSQPELLKELKGQGFVPMLSEDDYDEDREYTAESRTLYYINRNGLYSVGIDFSIGNKIENYEKKFKIE